MKTRIHIFSEWGPLEWAAVASPIYFRVTDPINATQRRFYQSETAPDRGAVQREHAAIVTILKRNGIHILQPTLDYGLPLQFNVRDAVAIIHDTMIECRMARPIRANEPPPLIEAITSNLIAPMERLPFGTLEGGDVIVDGNIIYIGISERTNREGIQGLSQVIGKSCTIVDIGLAPNILHLDTVLSLPSSDVAIVFPPAFRNGLPSALKARDLIIINEEEFNQQAANVFPLSGKKLLVDQRQKRIIEELLLRKFVPVPVELDHITRIGGGLRCMIQALARR